MKHYLYIGLGNPGEKYQRTRHNLGIRALRAWAPDNWHTVKKLPADLAQITLPGATITCLFPLTNMNRSGVAVRRFLRQGFRRIFRPLPLNRLLIIHDDLELTLGQFRLKQSGSARGHNGVRSIHNALGTQDISRLLLGIGPKPDSNTSDFVLGKFTPTEEETVTQMIPQVLETLNEFAKT